MKELSKWKSQFEKKLQPCWWARRKWNFPGCGMAMLSVSLRAAAERTRVGLWPAIWQPRWADGPMGRCAGQCCPVRASSQTGELRSGKGRGLPLGGGFHTEKACQSFDILYEKSIFIKDFLVAWPYQHLYAIIYDIILHSLLDWEFLEEDIVSYSSLCSVDQTLMHQLKLLMYRFMCLKGIHLSVNITKYAIILLNLLAYILIF